MSDILTRILADKAAHVAARKAAVSRADLEAQARAQTPPRGFKAALDRAAAEGRWGLIAEIKKASPSKGLIRPDFDPPAHARAYAEGGATCLSVLTDEPYFQGADAYLVAARAAVDLPVLRKDFMIDPWQMLESRAIGADCVLLIVAALSQPRMAELEAAALEQGMDVLVEVHDAAELERALRLKSRLIGVNNRNLKTFRVDLDRSVELAGLMPSNVTKVAESGLSERANFEKLAAAGFNSFLVGESLMRQPDIAAATRALLAWK